MVNEDMSEQVTDDNCLQGNKTDIEDLENTTPKNIPDNNADRQMGQLYYKRSNNMALLALYYKYKRRRNMGLII